MASADGGKPTIEPPGDSSSYTVVARRYRPQSFEDVVGQDPVVQALRNAILHNRLGHAYLFSGTRGVGKTSIARIFAKCLNCVNGPTDTPCLRCDICQSIAVGQDVDVIEIDGASNNGVESVRELRQNAGLRPSRARFKIYYIDEVHMLSTGAFNALLKTLEEPPSHVKFFFATTEPGKIPITVLSRCQRYDFAGISPDSIVATLLRVCEIEKISTEPEALRIVARRSGGSMRDAQSLLEQLLSSAGDKLTVEAVHRLLGTASDERLLDLLDALSERDAPAVFRLVDAAVGEGIQPVDLLGGLIDYVRDAMVMASGADSVMLTATPRQKPRMQTVVERWSLDTILAALQILAEARGRLRGSPHGRVVVELALIKIARLEDLGELSSMIARLASLESGAPSGPAPLAAPSVKKKPIVAEPEPTPPAVHREPPSKPAVLAPTAAPAPTNPDEDRPPLRLEEAIALWPKVIEKCGLRLGKGLGLVSPTAILGPNVLVIGLGPRYNWIADECGKPEAIAQIEQVLHRLFLRNVTIRFERTQEDPSSPAPTTAPVVQNRREDVAVDPMVQKVVELFEARAVHVEVEEGSPPS